MPNPNQPADFARWSTVGQFAAIARKFHQRRIELKKIVEAHLSKVAESEDEASLRSYEVSNEQSEMTDAGFVAIVFAASALEAYIYDYAARNLSDSFVANYLDKLDLASKWVLVPQLVTGHKFPTDDHAFQLLKELIKARNAIVHTKSSPIDLKKVASGEVELPIDKLLANVDDAIRTLDELARVMEKIHPEEHSSFWLGSRTDTDSWGNQR